MKNKPLRPELAPAPLPRIIGGFATVLADPPWRVRIAQARWRRSNVVWAKRRIDGGPDGRGVGFYFRNVTELLLFGVRGSMRTLALGRSQVNMIETRKREHSRKPDEQYALIESCSPGAYLEMFARHSRPGWTVWGDESSDNVVPRGVVHKGYEGGPFSRPYFKPARRIEGKLPQHCGYVLGPNAHLACKQAAGKQAVSAHRVLLNGHKTVIFK